MLYRHSLVQLSTELALRRKAFGLRAAPRQPFMERFLVRLDPLKRFLVAVSLMLMHLIHIDTPFLPCLGLLPFGEVRPKSLLVGHPRILKALSSGVDGMRHILVTGRLRVRHHGCLLQLLLLDSSQLHQLPL